MGTVCAGLGWQPADFWRATPHEVTAIAEAKAELSEVE